MKIKVQKSVYFWILVLFDVTWKPPVGLVRCEITKNGNDAIFRTSRYEIITNHMNFSMTIEQDRYISDTVRVRVSWLKLFSCSWNEFVNKRAYNYVTKKGLTAEYPSTPKEILKSVATRLRRHAECRLSYRGHIEFEDGYAAMQKT